MAVPSSVLTSPTPLTTSSAAPASAPTPLITPPADSSNKLCSAGLLPITARRALVSHPLHSFTHSSPARSGHPHLPQPSPSPSSHHPRLLLSSPATRQLNNTAHPHPRGGLFRRSRLPDLLDIAPHYPDILCEDTRGSRLHDGNGASPGPGHLISSRSVVNSVQHSVDTCGQQDSCSRGGHLSLPASCGGRQINGQDLGVVSVSDVVMAVSTNQQLSSNSVSSASSRNEASNSQSAPAGNNSRTSTMPAAASRQAVPTQRTAGPAPRSAASLPNANVRRSDNNRGRTPAERSRSPGERNQVPGDRIPPSGVSRTSTSQVQRSAPEAGQNEGGRQGANPPAPPRGRSSHRPPSTASDYGDGQRLIDPESVRIDMRGGLDQGHDNIVAQQLINQQIVTSNLNPGVVAPHSAMHPRSGHRTDRNNDALPDILNSHILPPYSGRQNQHRPSRHGGGDRHNERRQRERDPRHARGQNSSGQSSRHPVRPARRRPPPQTMLDEEDKGCCNRDCCLGCMTIVTTFRWVLVSLAMLGVCCVVTGIILGALHITEGSSFLTLSLMFIGLGVMLVVVVGVGWKCTPHGHEPCHLLFNLGDYSMRDIGRSRTPRQPRDRNHWYGGTLYPEFRYRRPPPSYNASMQDYQHQLMAAQIHQNPDVSVANTNGQEAPDNLSLPSSPPPTYRSRASMTRPALHITFPSPQGGDYPSSRPPTYRSHAGTLGDNRASRPAIEIQGEQQTDSNRTDDMPSGEQASEVLPPTGETHDNLSELPQDGTTDSNIVHTRSASAGGLSTLSVDGGTDSRSSTLTQRGIRMVEHLEVMLDNTLRDMDNAGMDSTHGNQSPEHVNRGADFTDDDDAIADVRL